MCEFWLIFFLYSINVHPKFFLFQFYQRNGRPYPISNGDNLLVEIMHGTNKVALTAQHGGPDAGDMNSTKVAFTVHKSGEYKISVMVGARHIRGSPFIKKFKPGKLWVMFYPLKLGHIYEVLKIKIKKCHPTNRTFEKSSNLIIYDL